jgi:shikimate kinase
MLIFIIGYMGAGKTTLGAQLASRLGYRFLDLDDLIVSETGCSIVQLFEQSGEVAFRIKEREVFLKHIDDTDTVIATGGGAPCYSDNMDLMNAKGLTIFLDVPFEIILERIKEENWHRPMLKDVAAEKLPEFIKTHLESRMKYYRQAKLKVKPGDDLLLTLSGPPLSDADRSE